MSVYRDNRSPYYTFEFQIEGKRFKGTTGVSDAREAAAVERAKRAEAKAAIAAGAFDAVTPTTLKQAFDRYFSERAMGSPSQKNFEQYSRVYLEYFGGDKRLCEIDDNELSRFIAWKMQQPKWGDGAKGVLAPGTMNRIVLFLRTVMVRATDLWAAHLPKMPKWKRHLLKEPESVTRVLTADEYVKLFESIDPDYAPLAKFALLSGMRLTASLLKWENVDFDSHSYRYHGKGGKRRQKLMTPEIEKILRAQVGLHHEWVFTFTAQRNYPGRKVIGEQRPITRVGLSTYWRRLKKRIGLKNFRWHDLRHTFATNLLMTSNLAVVQEALDHSNPAMSRRYAHVMPIHLRDAMAAAEQRMVEAMQTPLRLTYKPGEESVA